MSSALTLSKVTHRHTRAHTHTNYQRHFPRVTCARTHGGNVFSGRLSCARQRNRIEIKARRRGQHKKPSHLRLNKYTRRNISVVSYLLHTRRHTHTHTHALVGRTRFLGRVFYGHCTQRTRHAQRFAIGPMKCGRTGRGRMATSFGAPVCFLVRAHVYRVYGRARVHETIRVNKLPETTHTHAHMRSGISESPAFTCVLYLSVGSCKGVWRNPINRSVVVVRSLLCDEHNVQSGGRGGRELMQLDLI